MKKLILIALLVLFEISPCMAFQNYMLMTDYKLSNIKVSNENILTVEPMVNLKYYGQAMMLIPHNVGNTRLSFCKGKKRVNLCIRVKENETCIKRVNGVKLIPVDLPPELR